MPDATRIVVGKNDEATVVAEQLIDADTDSIIFAIPKGSVFGQSLNNFKLLKREGEVLGKEIIIESDDAAIQQKAVKAGLEIGETVAAADEGATADDVERKPARGGKLPRGRSLRVRAAEETEETVGRVARVKKKTKAEEKEEVIEEEEAETEEEEEAEERPLPIAPARGEPFKAIRRHGGFWSRRRVTVATLILVVGLAGGYGGLVLLPKATVNIALAHDNWQYAGTVIIDKSVTALDPATNKIPGQVFTQKATATVKLPATGKQFVERKATGLLTVYNAYSSQPQSIVATTRFVTPEGTVFRIVKPLTIPGAKIENGTIIPSSVTAEVIADKAGDVGNVGSVARLSIPGFAKTPKYQGFYGELKEGTTGGFSGNTKVATEADIKAAKAEGAKQAETLVRKQMEAQVPAGFKVAESATKFAITKQMIDDIADESGNFTVETEAQLSLFAFREQDIRTFLQTKLAAEKGDFEVAADELTYGTATGNIVADGRVSLPITYTATLAHVLDVDGLRDRIAGQSQTALTTMILGTPGITGGTVNLWPFYVRRVPRDVAKIHVVIEDN